MRRTTVKIPDELDRRLRHAAEREGKTISELTRAALEAYLGESGGIRRRRLLSTGAMHGDGSGVAARIEEILADEGFSPYRS